MTRSLVLPVAVPLACAAAAALARDRLAVQRALAFGAAATVFGYAVALVFATSDGRVLVAQVGGWPPGIAIPLVADLFSALMLVVGALMVLVVSAFAVARGDAEHRLFHPLVLVLMVGIAGAFLTADLFNLFVFFEVMLIASYVLATLGGSRRQLRGGMVYVATNLFASTLLVAGVAVAYGTAGTVNLAGLGRAATSPGLEIAGALLLVAFAIKASLVPLHGWLPRAYPVASPAVAALFSGLLTKVGVYALYRVYSVVFAGEGRFRTLLLVVASVTMLVGVLGAVGRETIREILSFHIVSQVGYMIMGLGLFGSLGLAGGIFYVLHHIVVKTSLFLAAGVVETDTGTGVLDRLGGMAQRRPVAAAGFIVAALSLAGLPPLSGFFAKLALVRASFEGAEYGVAAVAIVVSLLTLTSMLKIWNAVWWGERVTPAAAEETVSGHEPVGAEADPPAARRFALVAPGVFLALVSVGIGLGAHGLMELTSTAGEVLGDAGRYIEAVLGP